MQSCFWCLSISQEWMTVFKSINLLCPKDTGPKAQDRFLCFAPFELYRQNQRYKWSLIWPDIHTRNLAEPWHQWYSQMKQKVAPVPMSMSDWVEAPQLAFLLECFAVLACHLTGWCLLIDPAPVLIDVWVCKHYRHSGARWPTYQA